ncbi:murein hydrolase activator EnvC family protein [Altererythrobacter sp. Z27]|uniref:murein hydrolase activator EnvC family protein n=1 Tax=Altererythrobacter sp. Z27 TaxID=3461147 RepID=UPI004044C4A8
MPAFRFLALTGLVAAPIAAGLIFAWPVAGASDMLAVGAQMGDAGSAREAYARARRAAADAERRAQRFDKEATETREAADRSAREAAALAARIQQAEADILAAQARFALITDQRRLLDARLAEQQQPLVRLTAALQNMARRPLVLSALQPGTLKDTVYVRAVLETTMPEIRNRTVGLRGELARGRELEREAGETLASLRMDEGLLLERRRALETLATQQRLASREVRQVAQRESERALALSENARDLNSLVDELGRAGALRAELAALPGPLVRPPRPGASQVLDAQRASPTPRPTALPAPLQLPVQGRTLAGFGESDAAGLPVTGLRLAPGSGAQVIAPAAGRVAFAGPYRGYGQIVIVEHGNGFTSLVTGLAQADVAAGDEVIGGSPIGTAARRDPAITLELRRDGQPVNPLDYM